MKPSAILQQLTGIYGEKAALWRRHEAVARHVGQYDVNNTYQYVIAREDQHVSWLRDAVADLGGILPEVAEPGPIAAARGDLAHLALAREDAERLDAFVRSRRDAVGAISHARHRRMLEVLIGETLEHARLFRQAAAGSLDLIGRRTGGDRMAGTVLPTRWVE